MDDKVKVWESIQGSWEAMSRTYAGIVKKSRVQNLHHGNLNISGFYHDIGPYYWSENSYLIMSMNTSDITKGFT